MVLKKTEKTVHEDFTRFWKGLFIGLVISFGLGLLILWAFGVL